MRPPTGFRGMQDETFLSAGFGIGSKIVAGFGIQISAGFGIGQKIIAGYGIQISRGTGIRSEIFSIYEKWSIFTFLQNNRNSRIDSTKYKEIVPLNFKT